MADIQFKQAHAGNYRAGRTGSIRYIVVHYTGNTGDTAKNNVDYFARVNVETSAHYFVDETEVWQSVRDEDTAYHCGAAAYKHPECRNANSIGVEMCNSVGGVPDAVRDRTAAFVRELMEKYGVPVEHVLRHYDVTGKVCPAPWVQDESAWQAFKDMLTERESEDDTVTQDQFDAMMDDYLARLAQAEPSDWSQDDREWAESKGLIQGDQNGNKQYMAFTTREAMMTFLHRFYNLVKEG